MIDLKKYWLENGHVALVRYCQEYINKLPTINQTVAEAKANGNLMSKENIHPVEIVYTKAKTIYGIHRALCNSVFKMMTEGNAHEYLVENMPYIEDGIFTIQKDGIIYWITEEDYREEMANNG